MSEKNKWSGRNLEKDKLRNRIWHLLKEKGVTQDDPFYTIPDFTGSEKAARKLSALNDWESASVMMCCPDVPQIPVRLNALKKGMIVYMAIPKLVDEKCFVKLTSENILENGGTLEEAATWQGALMYGKPVTFEEMKHIDLTVTGCVAVTRSGGRTGKGAGFADIEYALVRKYGLINNKTPIITTVHPLMIVPEEWLPIQKHDTYLNLIVTPEEIIRISTECPQPSLDWSLVRDDQLESIPILRKLLKEENINR